METHVEVRNVWRSFDHGRIDALKGVNLEVGAGGIVAVCGPAGSGKSTLLNVISGLEGVNAGEVKVSGHDVVNGAKRVELLRHHIGHVFQYHHLMPDLTLAENCMIPVIAAGGCRAAARERLIGLAEATEMRYLLKRRVSEISGGERQRGALIRSLINNPQLLLCDEPTGGLDERESERFFSLLLGLVRARRLTLIMATHDPVLAKLCDRTLRMRDGRIEGQIR